VARATGCQYKNSPSPNRGVVINSYVIDTPEPEQQAEHHRTRTFREEYPELLRRGGVEFDNRHL
jgi:hypothetical protein